MGRTGHLGCCLGLACALSVVALAPAAAASAPGLPAPWRWQTIVGLGFPYTPPLTTSWTAIGDRFNLSPRQLALANRMDWRDPVQAGSRVWISDQRIVPWRPGTGWLINVPEGRLDIIVAGKHVGSWPVAVGTKRWPTPLGHYPLGRPQWQPTWFVPASIQAEAKAKGLMLPPSLPPGPTNPLGEVWLPLGRTGVGLHGTPPDTVWADLRGSHGCLRLAPDHAREVARWWQPGVQVEVVYQRAKWCQFNGQRYLEVHPDPYDLQHQPPPAVRALDASLALAGIWQRACGVPLRWP